MSDSEPQTTSPAEGRAQIQPGTTGATLDEGGKAEHVDQVSEVADAPKKSNQNDSGPSNTAPPSEVTSSCDATAVEDLGPSPAENKPADGGSASKPSSPKSKRAKSNLSSGTVPFTSSEAPHLKNASDPSPEARALRGEEDSDASEQFFTPTATPPIAGHEISSRTMTEAEEEELAKLRNERNSDNRRRNAFYGGNQEAERKKIGLDHKETIPEPPLSNSGIASLTAIRCTLGKRNDKLKAKSARITVAYADTQGRRPSMEDDFVFIGQFRSDPHLDLIGLFDGHRGTSAARYAARELSAVLDQHMKHSSKPREALHESFLELHNQMRGDDVKSGTTAIVSLLTADKVFIANAGDSRAVLCRGSRAIRLTTDHRPDTTEEIARITKLGGDIQDVVTKDGKVISRVAGLLGVSRALGDFDMEPFVTPHPEVAEFSWGPDEPDNKFVIVACDGLWECVPDQEAVDIASHFIVTADAESACKRLRDIAYARGSTDNISVCIYLLAEGQDNTRTDPEPQSSSSSASSMQSCPATDDPANGKRPQKPKRRTCNIV